MDKLAVVVLAAGLGKRMGKDLPKVILKTRERPLIQHVLTTANSLNPERIVVVVGHKRELVEETVSSGASEGLYPKEKIRYALQSSQKGTGDAVKAALPELEGFVGTVVILYGDVPITRVETLRSLIERHHADKATLSLVVLHSDQFTAYGRILRDDSGHVSRIVELKDCSPLQVGIRELNPGIYAVDSSFLAPAVSELKNENAQKEYYLTDIVQRAAEEGQSISSIITADAGEVQGVNTPVDLEVVNRILRERQVLNLVNNGVIIEDSASLYLDPEVKIASGCVVGPQVQIRGKSSLKTGVKIEGCALIIDSEIEEEATIKFSCRIESSKIGKETQIGPFAHLRAGTILGEDVKVGNFVETKQAVLHNGAKASHLSYLGDCEVGKESNIGAGVITCNYDGVNKHRTKIGENTFIGSDTCLVAPVSVGDGALIGAGSVITKDVPKDALGLSRAPQTIREEWAAKRRESLKKS